MAWLQAIHVVSCVAWGGALLVLCHWLATHAARPVGREDGARRTARQRYARWLITVAAGLTVFTGVWLINIDRALMAEPWVQARIACAVGLIVVDALSERGVIRLAEGSGGGRAAGYRALTAAAVLFAGAMLALGVVQPEVA